VISCHLQDIGGYFAWFGVKSSSNIHDGNKELKWDRADSYGHHVGHSDPACVDYGPYRCGPSSHVEFMPIHLAGRIIRYGREARTPFQPDSTSRCTYWCGWGVTGTRRDDPWWMVCPNPLVVGWSLGMVAPMESKMCSKATTRMSVVVIVSHEVLWVRFVLGVPTSWLVTNSNHHRPLKGN
jgi:hypothetical protein